MPRTYVSVRVGGAYRSIYADHTGDVYDEDSNTKLGLVWKLHNNKWRGAIYRAPRLMPRVRYDTRGDAVLALAVKFFEPSME